ncbi:hypothetical protein BO71DRAFT_208309 [Aspergillus ellipticus CBS 707.79]|uniref:SH3 domain-containing protein n=1 Tax=Aspergillus ellipticus CBS 707.79 TaxID=1448320 RepID=A0A319DCU6_9EURO|nr:hypothetical protein BO71DRAFT_208309 [Aspergillus ellipticus CBS 707.79]
MFLTATPDRGRPNSEKEEIAQKYKPGDSVFPALPSPERHPVSDDEDRRLLREVQELSLQESRARTRSSGQRSRQSSRTRRTGSTDADASRRRREEEHAARRQRPAQTPVGGDLSQYGRTIEHQSSLRSLLSFSDTETMQEEILRQIFEEGLLDDIDLDNLGPSQEEELSERIADAYRRRHRLRSHSQQRPESHETRQSSSSRPRARSQSVQRPQDTSTSSRNPPVSRSYLLDPLVSRNGAPGHQRRLSDQGSSQRRTSPVAVNPASSSEVALRPAARSSSNMVADRPRGSQAARVRTAESATLRSRRATASDHSVPNIWVGNPRERAIRRAPGRLSIDSPRVIASPDRNMRNGSWPTSPEVTIPATSSLLAEIGGPSRPEARSRPSSSRSNVPRSATSYSEPSISCDRCSRPNIQYELHKKCPKCKDGEHYLCLRCYRTNQGCLDWPGFKASAEAGFERILASSNGQPPPSPESQQHILLSRRYRRAPNTAYRSDRDGRVFTTDDPARRLQTGFFCDTCQSPANDCYWKCNQCNEGDWGFCNHCVNQGRCCTHTLLPICRIGPGSNSSSPPAATSNTSTTLSSIETYKILSIATNCDICAQPIADSTPRFHCLQCNDGDYDICTSCYLRLVAIGKIRKENGHNGWRRCPKGHRMTVIGFEEHEEGQRRVIVHDLVGGRALNDDHLQPSPTASPSLIPTHIPTSDNPNVASPGSGSGDWSWKEGSERRKKASRLRPWTIGDRDRDRDRDRNSEPSTPTTTSPFPNSSNPTVSSPTPARRFPPDGGVGLVLHALWSWYPEDGVQDELMFPRGAEITEAENINEDWYWGCYAGLTGLFPGTHVFIAGEVV